MIDFVRCVHWYMQARFADGWNWKIEHIPNVGLNECSQQRSNLRFVIARPKIVSLLWKVNYAWLRNKYHSFINTRAIVLNWTALSRNGSRTTTLLRLSRTFYCFFLRRVMATLIQYQHIMDWVHPNLVMGGCFVGRFEWLTWLDSDFSTWWQYLVAAGTPTPPSRTHRWH